MAETFKPMEKLFTQISQWQEIFFFWCATPWWSIDYYLQGNL